MDENHSVRYFNELTNMAMLTGRSRRGCRIIARRYGEQSKRVDKIQRFGKNWQMFYL